MSQINITLLVLKWVLIVTELLNIAVNDLLMQRNLLIIAGCLLQLNSL